MKTNIMTISIKVLIMTKRFVIVKLKILLNIKKMKTRDTVKCNNGINM